MQLLFVRDAYLNTRFDADWNLIRQSKQKRINRDNERENSKRIPYTYRVGEPIVLKTASNTKYGKNPYVGPFRVIQVNNNGTVRYTDGTITDTVNLRNIHPYHVQEPIH